MFVKNEYRIYRSEVSPETLENISKDLQKAGYRLIPCKDHLRFIKHETVELCEDMENQEHEEVED